MSDNYQDYLEEMYDGGNIVKEYKQIKDDEEKAKKIVEDVKEIQEKAKMEETKRILGKEEVTESEINKVFDNYGYGEEDIYGEYLVDGAILKCNKAILTPFDMGNEPDISLTAKENESSEEFDNRQYTTLDASENPISDNGLTYATVNDTVENGNIAPFRCHCAEKADRFDEAIKIKNDPKAREHGVCRHLMKLNSEWENLSKEKISYMSLGEISKAEPVAYDGYLQAVRRGDIEDVNLVSKKEGITMTSILFCKHGGIISPVTSGQIYSDIMDIALYNMERYLDGKLTEEKALRYVQIVAQNCNLGIGKIEEGDFEGMDITYYLDDYILAWSYYWNKKVEEGVFGNNLILVRPDVVKAMIMDESSWGTDSSLNGTRDVMQSLVPGDPGLWLLSGYDPTDKVKSHIVDGKSKVWVKDGETYDEMGIVHSNDFYYWYNEDRGITNTNHYGFGDGLDILKDNVITIITDSDDNQVSNNVGEYFIHYDKVTVNMGIACGIGYLATNMNRKGSEKGGVEAYNGGGAEAKTGIPYTDTIDDNLKCIKYENGKSAEPLRD